MKKSIGIALGVLCLISAGCEQKETQYIQPGLEDFNPKTCQAGEEITVTIKGTALADAATVIIADGRLTKADGDIISASETEVVVKFTPAMEMEGPVAVITPVGKATSVENFIVSPKPTIPTVTEMTSEVEFFSILTMKGTNLDRVSKVTVGDKDVKIINPTDGRSPVKLEVEIPKYDFVEPSQEMDVMLTYLFNITGQEEELTLDEKVLVKQPLKPVFMTESLLLQPGEQFEIKGDCLLSSGIVLFDGKVMEVTKEQTRITGYVPATAEKGEHLITVEYWGGTESHDIPVSVYIVPAVDSMVDADGNAISEIELAFGKENPATVFRFAGAKLHAVESVTVGSVTVEKENLVLNSDNSLISFTLANADVVPSDAVEFKFNYGTDVIVKTVKITPAVANIMHELTLKVGTGSERYLYDVITGERAEAKVPASLPAGRVFVGITVSKTDNKGAPSAEIQKMGSPYVMLLHNLINAGDIEKVIPFLESGEYISRENLPDLDVYTKQFTTVSRHYYSEGSQAANYHTANREGANVGGYTVIALKANSNNRNFDEDVLAFGIMHIESISEDGLLTSDPDCAKKLENSEWKVKVWFPKDLLELIEIE